MHSLHDRSPKGGRFRNLFAALDGGGIIKRCGGDPVGYFLPKKGYGGADNIAMTLIGFENLTAYEEYRKKLVEDPEAKENVEFAKRSGCIMIEDRSYFYRIGTEAAA